MCVFVKKMSALVAHLDFFCLIFSKTGVHVRLFKGVVYCIH